MVYVYDWENNVTTSIQANKNFPKTINVYDAARKRHDINPESLDYGKKCLHVGWHPREDFVAVGASNNLFLYESGPVIDDDSD